MNITYMIQRTDPALMPSSPGPLGPIRPAHTPGHAHFVVNVNDF